MHYVRDVSMDEDRCRVRAGARALATLRNLVLCLIRARGLSVREARENFREDRAEAIAVVTGRILRMALPTDRKGLVSRVTPVQQ